MGFHGGYHRRLAPTIDIVANFGFRHADDGAERTPPPPPGAADTVAESLPTPPRASRATGLGAMVRNGLSRLLAVNF